MEYRESQQLSDLIRVGASLGLKPAEVYGMTLREFELFAQGRAEANDQQLETTAWALSLLLSAWSSKGKRIRMDDLLSTEHRDRRRKRGAGGQRGQAMPVTSLGALEARIKAVTLERHNTAWWASREGDRVRKFLALYGENQTDEQED